MTFLSLFAGIGGFDLGLERAGMKCIGQVEIDPFCQRVLAKHWPGVWKHGDVKTVTRELIEQHCGIPDLICGGFPCQDISDAGKKAGIDGARSGLWSEFARIICELRPRFAVVENVAALLRRGAGRVFGDLVRSGYDAEWDCIPAANFGAPHRRDRIVIIAQPHRLQHARIFPAAGSIARHSHWAATQEEQEWHRGFAQLESVGIAQRCASYADALRILDGIPKRLDRVAALGNAVVPQVAEFIGRQIMLAAGGGK